jgi:hypothetical protein
MFDICMHKFPTRAKTSRYPNLTTNIKIQRKYANIIDKSRQSGIKIILSPVKINKLINSSSTIT